MSLPRIKFDEINHLEVYERTTLSKRHLGIIYYIHIREYLYIDGGYIYDGIFITERIYKNNHQVWINMN